MLVLETVAKIRRAYFVQRKPIKAICRELRVSRRVVRKVLRSEATEFHYERGEQPLGYRSVVQSSKLTGANCWRPPIYLGAPFFTSRCPPTGQFRRGRCPRRC